MVSITASSWLPPGNVLGLLPLLNLSHVDENGRFDGNESSSLVPTLVKVHDTCLSGSSEKTLDLNGFEYGELAEGIFLPDFNEYDPAPPYTSWTSTRRPLKKFVDQFSFRLSPIRLPSTSLFLFSCSGELIRGSTATGSADVSDIADDGGIKSSSQRWPPSFNAHVDQDIDGEPLRSLAWGFGINWLFRAPPFGIGLRLFNLWIPLNDAQVRPLALMDKAKQLENNETVLARWSEGSRFGVKSDRFIVTEAGANDDELWWFNSQLKRGSGIVFSTTETPHASFGRHEATEQVRHSFEMRCAGVAFSNELAQKLHLYMSSFFFGLVLLFIFFRRKIDVNLTRP